MVEDSIKIENPYRPFDLSFRKLRFDRIGAGREIRLTRGRTQYRIFVDGYPAGTTPGPSAQVFSTLIETATGSPELLQTCRGCFAAVIVDEASHQIAMLRDPLGGRVLYYTLTDGVLGVGSDPAALAAMHPEGPRENPVFLRELFVVGYPITPGITAFEGVHEVRPGEVIRFDGHRLECTQTAFNPILDVRPETVAQWVEALLDCFQRAVERSLLGESDIGIMLSGGMDSGPTAAMARSAHALGERRIEAISWSLESFQDCNEARWIRKLASALKLPLRIHDASHKLPFSELDKTLVTPDFPIYNPFQGLLHGCYEQARNDGFGILLNAGCGDQTYPHRDQVATEQFFRGHVHAAYLDLVRSIRRNEFRQIRSNPDLRSLIGSILSRVFPARLSRSRRLPNWLPKARHGRIPMVPNWPPELKQHSFPAHASALIGPAMSFGFTREPVAMAAHYGLDRRDPFQDPDLIRLMWNLPAVLAWKDGKEKWIMREAMRGILPDWHRNKGRTGLLFEFHDRGRAANREHIKEFLGDQRAVWQDWFEPDYIESQLNHEGIDRKGEMVLIRCIGYTLWREHLREMGVRG